MGCPCLDPWVPCWAFDLPLGVRAEARAPIGGTFVVVVGTSFVAVAAYCNYCVDTVVGIVVEAVDAVVAVVVVRVVVDLEAAFDDDVASVEP